MKVWHSVMLRILLRLTLMVAAVGFAFVAHPRGWHPAWITFVFLFAIFLTNGFSSLIPTKAEIRRRLQ